MGRRWLATYDLHDVNLTAIRPSHCIYVAAEHPERRPYSLTKRHLDPRFDPAIFLRESSLGRQTSRRIVSCHVVRPGVVFPQRLDNQVSVPVQESILSAAGVILQLIVSPAATTSEKAPLCFVRVQKLMHAYAGWPGSASCCHYRPGLWHTTTGR